MLSRKITYKDTILNVKCDACEADIFDGILEEAILQRRHVEQYITRHPEFATSLEPLEVPGDCPQIIDEMARAAKTACVGPMAAVAGAISEFCAKKAVELGAKSVLVENGGDICLCGKRDFEIKIFAGESELSNKLAFKINPGGFYGICTSSGTVGHSISFGDSDAAAVCAKNTAVADAVATAIGNEVKGKNGINAGLEIAKKIRGIDGVLIIRADKIGMWGKLPEIIGLD